MYKTKLSSSLKTIEVASNSGKTFSYSTDGKLANPLEAVFAAINGCAAVYTIKACHALNIPTDGIQIELIPKNNVQNKFNVFGVNSFLTKITFPENFTQEQKQAIIESVSHCAVKDLIKHGEKLEFLIETN